MRFLIPYALLGALSCASASAAELRIAPRAYALVRQPALTLADVALVSGGEAGQASRLGALVVGQAPQPGYTHSLSMQQLQRLVRASGVAAGAVWEGAPLTRIERAARPYAGAQLLQAASGYVQAQLTGAGYRPALVAPHPVADLQLPDGVVSLTPQPMMLSQLLQPQVQVRVDVAVDGVFFSVASVPFRVTAWRSAHVASRPLARGVVPGCADSELLPVDAAALGGELAALDCAAPALQLTRSIAAGQPLLRSDLRTLPAVQQGQRVLLRMDEGTLQIEAAATALSDGTPGQQIEVKTASSREPLLAEVVSAGHVKITRR